jgi:hypothetical protein
VPSATRTIKDDPKRIPISRYNVNHIAGLARNIADSLYNAHADEPTPPENAWYASGEKLGEAFHDLSYPRLSLVMDPYRPGPSSSGRHNGTPALAVLSS